MKKEIVELMYEKGKGLIQFWHEKRMEQIRLETANKIHLEELKYHAIEDIERKKRRIR